MSTAWAVILASALGAGITGATAILTQFLALRREQQRLEAERKDRLLALLAPPRLEAHQRLVQFLVDLRRMCDRFMAYGNEFHETEPPENWSPLGDLNRGEALYAESRLWIGPRVAQAFEKVIDSLGTGASCALSISGGGLADLEVDVETVVEGLATAIYGSAEKCEAVIQSALGLLDLERAAASKDDQESPPPA